MLETVIGLGVASTLGVAALIAAVWYWLRRDARLWRDASFFADLNEPEVIGFAVIKGRGRNRYVKFIAMDDASDPKHDDLAIVIRLRPNGNKYAIIDGNSVHCLDMAKAAVREDEGGRWAGLSRSYRRNKYHNEIFTPLIEKAFKDE